MQKDEKEGNQKPVRTNRNKSEKLKVSDNKISQPENSFTAGTSLNRPVSPNINDIYYEFDTGNRIRYTENGWDIIDNLK